MVVSWVVIIWWMSGILVCMLKIVLGNLIELVDLFFVLRMFSVVELVMVRFFLWCCG